mgnify:CR=1 FL=1|tara:strand:+ start:204 stop:1019 length:816 start_codon:yes stop_codon:yes gene_type:complete
MTEKRPNVTSILNDEIFKPALKDKLVEVKAHRNDASDFIYDVIDGTYGSALIYGNPGTGKTTLVQQALEKKGLQANRDYLIARSHITPVMLYVALYHTRRKGQFLVMDDCDTILGTEIGLNMIKAATDQTFREVRYDSTYNIRGVIQNIPNNFEYNGQLIITTNITPHQGKSKLAQHMDAIRSRCVGFAMNTDGNTDSYAHLFHMIYDQDMLADDFPKMTWDQKVDVLKFILKHLDDVRKLDLRKPKHIAQTLLRHPNNWRRKALRILRTA